MTTTVSEQARKLLAAEPHDKFCPTANSTGYCNCYTKRALRALEKALAQRPTLSPRDEVKKRILYVEFDGGLPTAAVYKEDSREVMRCSIDAPKLNEGVIAEVKELWDAAQTIAEYAAERLWNGRPDAIRDRPVNIDTALRVINDPRLLTLIEGQVE